MPSQNKNDQAGDSRPLGILPSTSSPICPKGNLLESEDIVESKRRRVESLLPMDNLATRSVNQNALDDFSRLSAAHALELLVQNQAEVGNSFFFFFFLL